MDPQSTGSVPQAFSGETAASPSRESGAPPLKVRSSGGPPVFEVSSGSATCDEMSGGDSDSNSNYSALLREHDAVDGGEEDWLETPLSNSLIGYGARANPDQVGPSTSGPSFDPVAEETISVTVVPFALAEA